MENKISKYIAASYTLYDVTDGKKEVIEQTVDKRPFDFLSGFGITIPAFEEALVNLNKGEHFDFTMNILLLMLSFHFKTKMGTASMATYLPFQRIR